MNKTELVPLVKTVVLNACLAYELHNHSGDRWRKIFKDAIQELPVKAGMQYRFLVRMSEQSREAMDKVSLLLSRA